MVRLSAKERGERRKAIKAAQRFGTPLPEGTTVKQLRQEISTSVRGENRISQAQAEQLLRESQERVQREEAAAGLRDDLRTQFSPLKEQVRTTSQTIRTAQAAPTPSIQTLQARRTSIDPVEGLFTQSFRNGTTEAKLKDTIQSRARFSRFEREKAKIAAQRFGIKTKGPSDIGLRAAISLGTQKVKEAFDPITSSKTFQSLFGKEQIKEKEVFIGRDGKATVEVTTVVGETPSGIISKPFSKAQKFVGEKVVKPVLDFTFEGGVEGIRKTAERTAALERSRGEVPLLGFSQAVVGGAAKTVQEKPLTVAATFGAGAAFGVAGTALTPSKFAVGTLRGLGTVGEAALIGTTGFVLADPSRSAVEKGFRIGEAGAFIAAGAGGFRAGSTSQFAQRLQFRVQTGIERRQAASIFKKAQKQRGTFELDRPRITESGAIERGFRPLDKFQIQKGARPEFAFSKDIQAQLRPKKFDPLSSFLKQGGVKPKLVSQDPLLRAAANPSQRGLGGFKVIDPTKGATIKITRPTGQTDLTAFSRPKIKLTFKDTVTKLGSDIFPKGGLTTSLSVSPSQVPVGQQIFRLKPQFNVKFGPTTPTSQLAPITTQISPTRITGFVSPFKTKTPDTQIKTTRTLGGTDAISKPSFSIKTSPTTKLLTPTKSVTKTRTVTLSTQTVGGVSTKLPTLQPTKTPPTPPSPSFAVSPAKKSIPPPTFLGGFTFRSTKSISRSSFFGRKRRKVTRKDTPTLFAAGFQIFGKRTAGGVRSGLGLRLLKGKKKKKKKRRGLISI